MRLKIAPYRSVRGRVALPASKSISNRMLVINELSGGAVRLHNVSDCDDTLVMRRALRERGAVTDVMAAGTAMRFLTALFAATESDTVLTGTERMRHRPIHVLVDALRSLGADISYVGEEGFPPLHVRGRGLAGGRASLPGDVSSQYVSALLMVAPLFDNGLRIELCGEVISRPYIGITVSLMRGFGIRVDEPDSRTFAVSHGQYSGGDYTVENDWSAASYCYELLALAGEGEVVLEGLFEDSLQGDACVRDLFAPLGVATSFEDGCAVLRKTARTAERYERDLASCPDLAQTMAATCCALGVPFRFSGLQSLRIKETDRLAALGTELRKLGYAVGECGDSVLEWTGGRVEPQAMPCVDTYEDHRMAMSMAPCACVCGGLVINDAGVVGKSYPRYWDDLRSLGVETVEM